MEMLAILISAISLMLTIINFFWSIKHDRKKSTLEAYNQLQEQALDILNKYTKTQIENLKRSNKDNDYRIVSSCLARVEHFCVGIRQGIYDANVLYELSGIYFVSIYEKLKPIIDKKQKGFDNQKFYENFEKVAISIKNKLPNEYFIVSKKQMKEGEESE